MVTFRKTFCPPSVFYIYYLCSRKDRNEKKRLTPPSIKLFVSFIKCMLVWTEKWKRECNGHQSSKLRGPPPSMSGGGGGYAYKRKRRADQYILFYTIHFRMPSTPPTADLKGTLHENVTCIFYQISSCTAQYLVFRSMII